MTPFAVLAGTDENPRHALRGEIAPLEALLKAYTARRNAEQPEAEREKYWLLTDAALDRYLSGSFQEPRKPGPEEAIWISEYRRMARAAPSDLVRNLMRDLSLSRLELDVLMLSALPDLDFRFRRWFGLLQGDLTRVSLPVWMVLDILAPSLNDTDAREIFQPERALTSHRLVTMEASADGLLASPLRVDDRVVFYLLGEDGFDRRLAGLLTVHTPRPGESAALSGALDPRHELFAEHVKMQAFAGHPMRLLLQSADSRRTSHMARTFAAAAGRPLLEFDCARSLPAPNVLIELALREALFARAAILFRNARELLASEHAARHCAAMVEAIAAHPGLVMVETPLAPPGVYFPDSLFVPINIPAPSYDDRVRFWTEHLGSGPLADQLAGSFLLTEDQMEDALLASANLASRDKPFSPAPTAETLFQACRHQTGTRLMTLAQRLEPRPGLALDDVVLPEPNFRQLEELRNRLHRRREVHSLMGYERRMRLGRGLMALFAGASGTGKTMAAEVLASEQRCDLYKVDLSAVVSKWVGETEKNLNRIFDEAENCQAMLFFDEADALFGHRGEVKEARDRWANLEVNFLLQRIEEFSGVVILATNLRTNIDPAFSRRFHSVVDFPQPDENARFSIWRRTLPAPEFLALEERDYRLIAARFDLSGGAIRNAVLDASYRAMESESKKIELRHIAAAAAREYQKMGKPVTRSEFGDSLYQIALEEVLAPPKRGSSA